MAGAVGGLLGQAYIRVRMDQSLLSEGLSAIRSTVLGTMQEIAGVAGGILAAAGIQGISSSLAGLAQQFISTNDKMQQYTISLGVLLGSKQKAVALVNDIERMAAKTPFKMGDLTQAIVQLKIFGFEAHELIPTMKIIGDAAAAAPGGMADGVARISYALGEIRANGRFLGTEMRQLASAGIPAWDILAKKIGTTVAEVRNMGSRGELDSATYLPMLLEGMAERTGGTMKEKSRTWEGLMSTLQDETEFAMRDIGKPFFEAAWGHLQNIIDWLDGKGAVEFKRRMTDIVRSITEIANAKVNQAIDWLKGDGAAEFANSVKEAAVWLYEISMISLENIWKFLSSEEVAQVAKDMGAIAYELGRIAGVTLTNVTEWLASDTGREWLLWFRDLSSTIVTLIGDFGAFAVGAFAVSRAMTAISAVLPAIVSAAQGFMAFMTTGSLAALANPITLAATAVGLLAAAFIGAKLSGEEFGDYVSMMLGRIIALGGEAEDSVSKLRRQMSGESDYNETTATIEGALKGEATDEKNKALAKSIENLETERDEKLRKARIGLAERGVAVAPQAGESAARSVYRTAVNYKGAGREGIVDAAASALRAEQALQDKEEQLANRRQEAADAKARSIQQQAAYETISAMGQSLGMGTLGAIANAAEVKKAKDEAAAKEAKVKQGSLNLDGLAAAGMPFGMDTMASIAVAANKKREDDAANDKSFSAQFFDLGNMWKQIQGGIGQKDKQAEVATNTKQAAEILKRIEAANKNRDTKPKSPPKVG